MATLQDLLGYGAQGYNLYQIGENLQDARHDIKQGFDQGRSDIVKYQQPYQDYGLESMGNVKNRGDFGFTYDNYLTSDNYDWLRQQGQQGLERSAAAKSGLISGQTLADISKYNQNYAQTQYGNEFDRQLRGWQANTSKDLAGITTGAQTAQSMGTNLGDIAIGRGGSLAALHGTEMEMINRQLNSLGAQLANSPNAGAQTSVGSTIAGALKTAAGDLLDVDTMGNIFDAITGEIIGNLNEVSNWMGNFGNVGGLIDDLGNVDWGGLFTPTGVNNGMNAISSLFGGDIPTLADGTTTDYSKLFQATDANGMQALNLDLANTWVNDDSWWDKFSSGITEIGSDIWSGIKSFFL